METCIILLALSVSRLQNEFPISKFISFSEPILEATPQVYVTLILIGFSFVGGHWDSELWTSFLISIISAALGMAELFKNGPIRIVKTDGKMEGYFTPGFILLTFIVAFNMIGKGIWMALKLKIAQLTVLAPDNFTNFDAGIVNLVYIWALTCLLPQLLLVKSQNKY